MNHTQRSRIGLLATTLLAACSLIASSVSAEITAAKPTVKESFGLDGITWQTGTAYKSATLVVSGADGFRMQQNFQAGDTVFLDFGSLAKAAAPSGRYNYELTFTPLISAADKALAEEARSLGLETSFLAQNSITPVSGAFSLDNGNIVDRDLTEQRIKRTAAAKDQVINDDLIVDGSVCAGFDCVNGESFGFDTLRLKENNLRIKAQDTSSTASFPTQDWQLTFNDTTNGGQNKFAVECVSPGSSVPFTVEGCAPSHSLYVDDAGRIGLGTNSPVVELHVKDGDSPTLRLEQDGSSGFTPQIWDVAGNETNFFVRDATNGSKLPLRIRPQAPSNSIFVDTDGDIGLGTSSPESTAQVHVAQNEAIGLFVKKTSTGGFSTIRLQNNDGASENWDVRTTTSGGFAISKAGTGIIELEITAAGNITCPVGRTINGVACTGS